MKFLQKKSPKKYLNSSIRAALAGCLLSLGASPVFAQEQGEDEMVLEEVLVTARKMEESIQEVPVAITALGAEMIENLNLRNLEDIAQTTAGLIFESELGRGANRPVIRGQANILGSSGVSYFIDGVYITGSIDDYDVEDIERIEVVKGPQSALYGRNTYSGAINIITKSPGDEFAGRAKAIIASDDQYDVSATLKGPVGDTIGLGITARHYERGGIFTNTYDNTEIGVQESDSVSGVFTWTPSDNLDVRFRAYYAETEDGQDPISATTTEDNNCFFDNGSLYAGRGRYFCGVVDPLPVNTDYARQVPGAGNSWEILQTSLSVDWDITDTMSLTSITGYNTRDNISLTDGDYSPTSFQVSNFTPNGFPFVAGPPPWRYGYVGSMIDFTFASASDEEDLSQELRLQFEGDRWNAMIGGYYFDGSDDTRDIRELPPGGQDIADANWFAEFLRMQGVCAANPICSSIIPLFGSTIVVPRDQNNLDIRNTAVFGMITYELTDSWRITAEARYAEEKITQTAIVRDQGGQVTDSSSASATFDSFSPRLTVDWQVTDNNMLYALYAEGTKPGGFNSTVAIEAGLPTFEEEEVQSIEIGSKNVMLDGQMVANFAAYFNQIDGYQLTQNARSGQNTTSATVNAGDADVMGFEAEIQIRPDTLEGFTITTNYAYNDSEFTQGFDQNQGVLNDVADDGLVNCSTGNEFPDSGSCTSLYGSIEGKRIPRSAEHQFFLDLDFRRPFGSGNWEWFIGGNYFYESSKYAQVHNLAETGGTELVSARIGIQSDRWMFQFWGRNLTDEDNAANVLRYAEPTGFTRNFAVMQRRPTYYGLTATLNF